MQSEFGRVAPTFRDRREKPSTAPHSRVFGDVNLSVNEPRLVRPADRNRLSGIEVLHNQFQVVILIVRNSGSPCSVTSVFARSSASAGETGASSFWPKGCHAWRVADNESVLSRNATILVLYSREVDTGVRGFTEIDRIGFFVKGKAFHRRSNIKVTLVFVVLHVDRGRTGASCRRAKALEVDVRNISAKVFHPATPVSMELDSNQRVFAWAMRPRLGCLHDISVFLRISNKRSAVHRATRCTININLPPIVSVLSTFNVYIPRVVNEEASSSIAEGFCILKRRQSSRWRIVACSWVSLDTVAVVRMSHVVHEQTKRELRGIEVLIQRCWHTNRSAHLKPESRIA